MVTATLFAKQIPKQCATLREVPVTGKSRPPVRLIRVGEINIVRFRRRIRFVRHTSCFDYYRNRLINHCDLIITADRGYNGLHRLMLGSTSRHVLRHAGSSVLVAGKQRNTTASL